MKKIKTKILTLGCAIALLCSCDVTDYWFPLQRSEEGAFISLTVDELYEKAITNRETVVVLFSQPYCAECTEAKEQIEGYCELESVIMYNCELNSFEDYEKAYDVTTYADNAFPLYDLDVVNDDGSVYVYLPVVYFFIDTYVVFTVSINFVDFFTSHIQII